MRMNTLLADPDDVPLPEDVLHIGRVSRVRLMKSAHVHSQVELNFVLEGSMTYLFDGRVATLRAGDLALFWAAFPHRTIEIADPTYFVCIYLPIEMFLAIPGSENLKTAVLQGGLLAASRMFPFDEARFRGWREDVEGGPGMVEVVRDEIANRLRRVAIDGWRNLAEEHAADAEVRPDDPQRHRVHRMARFISEHASAPISVRDVAEAVGLHPNYAMTLFRKTLGMTINEYVTRQRLMLAHGLLLSSELDIAAIAYDAGFGSLSRFYEAFRARYGCTPRDIRRRFHQNRRDAPAETA